MTSPVAEFGTAILSEVDGVVVVEHADDTIGIHVHALGAAGRWCYAQDGLFWLDLSGEYRYRPVRFSRETPGVLICQRVRPGDPAAD